MQYRFNRIWAVPIFILLLVGLYYIPPIHSRLAWRLDSLRTRIQYLVKPPEEAVFQPAEQAQLDIAVTAMMQTLQATLTPDVATLAPGTPTPQAGPTLKPTVTPTPLPVTVLLEGVKYEHQHGRLNYCGPANFSMALTYWGWDGNRDVVGKAVKPTDKDKNVMPYELQDYIIDNVPGMEAIVRHGGDLDVLKRLVSAGFPVVVEKGIYELDVNGKYGWMGHYGFVTGYDDTQDLIIYQDTYQPAGADPGPNRKIKTSTFLEGWRAFNYVFVVVYPDEKEAEVLSLLGPYADEQWANQHALSMAQMEAQSLTDIDRFFAWFNVGTSHIALLQYADAAIAYDYAFNIYADLDTNDSVRPYRMMWYQTGPYKAYYYTNRFADVINLANTTLNDTIAEPVLEESLYWRGRAYYMAGKTDLAVKDYRDALAVHPKWIPATQAMQDLGIQP
ncbi:MAG TPA: C39 family peptidase [Anaerolineales bacterium]|nr:C39 family peptidase [Anaerolineales bacterium]